MEEQANLDKRGTPSYRGYFQGCRAIAYLFSDACALCVAEQPDNCPYHLLFEGKHFCFHPNRNDIVEQTIKE
jgi:hypothetical protein